MSDAWSPWKAQRVLLGAAARAEAIRQHVDVQDLLGTTLPHEVRVILRQFEQELAFELHGENDNGRKA
jgi:hypothetical protein